MESVIIFNQVAPWVASILIILALFLGIIFYRWSQQIQRKIELLLMKMKQDADNLEHLSQYIYETAYFKAKESSIYERDKNIMLPDAAIDELKEVKKQIQSIVEQQAEINQKLAHKLNDDTPKEKEISFGNKKIYSETIPPEKESKYRDISELIITYLKNLLQEKENVTAQELVYAMPSQYSLADIYCTLEVMKENNQIDWEEKSIHPQSILKLL